MSSDKSLQNLFNAALERSDAAERASFLEEACGADVALRERVEKLLRAREETGAFMAQPSRTPAGLDLHPTGRVDVPLTEKPGDRIGRYKLLQQIGEGGCGVVYMAEQEEPVRRRVALKVIKLGMDTKQVIARFEAERQALALMDHPNIARVLDAGTTDTGRPYFVMELVRGTKITEFCDQKELPTQDRLDLFLQVCSAIQHAHQKGIIHRDIKPSNILVTVVDGVPVPKVIDFGIAKATNNQPLTDKTVFTAFEQFIGTPAYMSPEQAELSGVDIDTRTDIYSLGVVLYELLTGSPPFDQKELLVAGLDEMRRTIREVEPVKPSTRLTQELVAAPRQSAADSAAENGGALPRRRYVETQDLIHALRGDLDWIAMKCLEKDRARRYETANALAADIRRHLDCEPVVARPPSRWYEFQKTVRRHKFGFAAAGAVVIALAIGLGISTWQFVLKNRAYHRASAAEQEQNRQRQIAETKEKQSQQVAQFLKEMLKSVEPSVALGRDTAMLREILDQTAERVGKSLKDQPVVQAELLSTIGVTYFELGDSQKAIESHREALRLRRTLFGETNVWVAASLIELGDALGSHRDLSEAEAVLRQALAIRRLLLGNNDADTARSMTALSGLLVGLPFQVRNLRETETLQREALAVQTNLFPEGNDDVFGSLNNLSTIVLLQNRLSEAEVICHEALKLSRKLHGAEHPDVATALTRLGRVLRNQNKLSEAEPRLRDGYLMRRKFLGSDHEYVFSALDSYAGLLSQQGKFAEAEAALRENLKQRSTRLKGALLEDMVTALFGQGKSMEAVELFREELAAQKKLYGEKSANILDCQGKLASALAKAGDPTGAETTYQELLRLSRKLPGQEQFIAKTLGEWGGFLQSQRRFEEAVAVHREELELRKKMPGDNYRFVDGALGRLALALESAGKLGEANSLYREELDRLRSPDGKAVAPANYGLGVMLHHFAAVLWRRKEFKEARPPAEEAWTLYQQHPDWAESERVHAHQVLSAILKELNDQPALESLQRDMLVHRRANLPAEHPEVANSLSQLSLSLLAQQKFTEAEGTAREALVICERYLPDDWLTSNSRSLLGGSLLGQKKYAEAESLLLSGYEGMMQREKSIPAAGTVRIPEALQHLVQLYQATGQPEKAAEWKKKLAEFNQTEAKK